MRALLISMVDQVSHAAYLLGLNYLAGRRGKGRKGPNGLVPVKVV